MALEQQQGDRHRQRQQHHRDAQGLGAEWLRVLQALDGLHRHQHRAGADEQGLGQAGQGLGLAVTVAVILVGAGRRA